MKRIPMPKWILIAYLGVIMALCMIMSGFVVSAGNYGVAAGEPLAVGVPVDRCPVFYQDSKTGEFQGIGIDLIQIAAAEAGYEITLVPTKEETLKDALDNEVYDIIMPFGSAIKSATGQSSIVSDNLMQTPFTLLTTKNGDIKDFSSLRVGMLTSLAGAADTVRQLYPGVDITLFDTMKDAAKALRSGKVDALLHNSYVWSYVLQKPSYSDLKVHPNAMFSMDFRVGTLDTAKGREIIEQLNKGIDSITDTQIQAVTLDYTTRRLYRYDLFDYLYEYGLFIIMGTLLIFALIVILVLKQTTIHLEQEKRMQELIDFDPLTGVLSMTGFRKRVTYLLRKYPNIPYMLSYNNIRDFKYINDSLGMEAGDELLRFWAQRSLETLGEEDAIGRIDGDHLVVLRSIGGNEKMEYDKEHVLEPVRNYFVDRGKGKKIQVCSGIYVVMPKDYKHIDVDHMLDYARLAEKKVRETHKDGYVFYNPKQWAKGKQVADVVSHLPIALENGEFKVWYQPQVDSETREITGAEALCRWNHPEQGWIPPAVFIPDLEEAGLIYRLDYYVWERACQDLQRWNKMGKHKHVSVNLSRCDLLDNRNIPEFFNDLIHKYELSPDQLRIEITETSYVQDAELLIKTTDKLRDYGFQVEMDDFGSGYSSLNMLKEVHVDRIKLDLRFLTQSGDPEKGRIIVSYMIKMARDLGMSLIAEGVETLDQAEFLGSQGCHEMQGYYFHKPMPVEDYEKLI